MKNKITLEKIYNIAYPGEVPFNNKKSLSEFFYVTTIAALVEKSVNQTNSVCAVDIICYFLDEMKIDMQDYYFYILKEFNNTNADATLYEYFTKDKFFEEHSKYNDYILASLGVDKERCMDENISFNLTFATLLMGEDFFKGLVKIKGEGNLSDTQKQYLSFINFFYNSQNKKDGLNSIVNLLKECGISKEKIIARRSKILHYLDGSLVEEIKEILKENKELKNVSIYEKLKELNINLSCLDGEVVGQEVAIKKVKNSILSAYAGFKDENSPIASFLLTGPTGVGKTETAKAVANACFDGKIYVVDMSTFKNELDISRLIGGSPNYVGYNDTNAFCEFLKENPKSVVLFDEIEKGHFGCHDLLMRILDEGEFINAKGEKISLRDTIIFCTTNFTQNTKNVAGFGEGITTEQKMTTNGIGLKKELVGRFSDVIEYSQLSKEACEKIVESKFLKKAIQTFEYNNSGKIKIKYNKTLLDKIIEDANTNLFGARALKKSINKNFISVISNYVIGNNCENKTLFVTAKGVRTVSEHKNNEIKEVVNNK